MSDELRPPEYSSENKGNKTKVFGLASSVWIGRWFPVGISALDVTIRVVPYEKKAGGLASNFDVEYMGLGVQLQERRGEGHRRIG